MKIKQLAVVAVIGGALILSACGSSDDDKASDPASVGGITAADVATALEYVGGQGGKADPSLEPFTIGFVNNQGAVPSFDEMEANADAAVAFVNDKLGGIDGHPVKLDKCYIQSEEDGQKCAAQLLGNKDIKIANLGLSVFGNKTFYDLIGGKFPVINTGAVTPADSTSKSVYNLDAGGFGAMQSVGDLAEKAGYKKLAILTTNNPAGKFLLDEIVLPDLKARGITATTAYLPDTSTTPDYVSALQTVGAKDADAIEALASGVAACVSLHDAMKQVSLVKPVIAVNACAGDPMPEKTGGGPQGWSMTGLSELVLLDTPQAKVNRNVIKAEGKEKFVNLNVGPKNFGDILTISRWAKAIGYDKLTPAAFEDQIAKFTGPAWLVPGEMKCGSNKLQIGICGGSVPNAVFEDGKWKSLEPYVTAK
ncbi:hypothetical protein BH09ACT10_BH09ACT10_31560 [soil metagenome]